MIHIVCIVSGTAGITRRPDPLFRNWLSGSVDDEFARSRHLKLNFLWASPSPITYSQPAVGMVQRRGRPRASICVDWPSHTSQSRGPPRSLYSTALIAWLALTGAFAKSLNFAACCRVPTNSAVDVNPKDLGEANFTAGSSIKQLLGKNWWSILLRTDGILICFSLTFADSLCQLPLVFSTNYT